MPLSYETTSTLPKHAEVGYDAISFDTVRSRGLPLTEVPDRRAARGHGRGSCGACCRD